MTRMLTPLAKVFSFAGAMVLGFSIMISPMQTAHADDGTIEIVILKTKINTCNTACTSRAGGSCSTSVNGCDKTSPACDEAYCDTDGTGCSCWK